MHASSNKILSLSLEYKFGGDFVGGKEGDKEENVL
jgi:hypothetical protein